MAEPILVCYATQCGATREVAEAVAKAMREGGVDVDVLPAQKVRSLAGYRMVVLGAPLYMFKWHHDALAFLSRHRKALEGTPAAVFALGPFNDVEKEWQEVRGQLDKELDKFPWFAPIARQVVGGRFDPALLRFPMSLIPGMKKIPVSDLRDWDAIHAWAVDLVRSAGAPRG